MMTHQGHAAHSHPRLDALRSRHEALSMRIEQELKHSAPSEHMVRQWKAQKLHLKDEMERLIEN